MLRMGLVGLGLCLVLMGCSDDTPYTEIAPTGCASDGDCEDGERCVEGECGLVDDGEPDVGTEDVPEVEDVGTEDVPEVEDVVEGPGIGEPCDVDDDCPSGFCIEIAGEGQRVCTDFCSPGLDTCPEGYVCAAVVNSGADRVFLCFPEAEIVCQACEADSDCGSLSDLCLDYPDGQFCGRSCGLQECPEGFDCVEVEGPNGPSAQCRSQANLCSACFDPDGDGYGEGPECRGLDCREDAPLIFEGAEEFCNNEDDDCDGVEDEGFDLQNDPERCGDCENACRFEGAEARCEAGVCALGPCLEDRYDVDNRPGNGCEYFCEQTEGGVEICDGIDNDCDGDTDEGNPGGGDACDTGRLGVCAEGVLSCTNGALVCEQTVEPIGELCNGLDDNCNGAEDEENPGGGADCDTGEFGVCSPGVEACTGGEVVCQRRTGPSGEVCNGFDDDCNGTNDNGCPASVSLGSDRNLGANGGSGGSAFTLRCNSGQAAVGVDVRSASEIDRLQVICQTMTVTELRQGSPYTYVSAATGNQARTGSVGGGGGSPRTFICPAGSFLQRLQVRSGSRIDQVSLTCAQANFEGYPNAPSIRISDTETSTFGGNGGASRAATRCRDNEFIAGFHGRAGGRLDRLGAICRRYAVNVR